VTPVRPAHPHGDGPGRSAPVLVVALIAAVVIALVLATAGGWLSGDDGSATDGTGTDGAATDAAETGDGPAGSRPPGAGSVDANATVERVVDGDTLVVDVDGRSERLRMIGVDTPESVKPDAPVECFGPEASAFTADLLPPDTPIRIERDVVGRDDFGRLLGYVYRADDGLFVNRELMRTGHATPLSIEPNTTFAQVFVADARDAERRSLGLWGACGQ
jgi:micrococcal nuclease